MAKKSSSGGGGGSGPVRGGPSWKAIGWTVGLGLATIHAYVEDWVGVRTKFMSMFKKKQG